MSDVKQTIQDFYRVAQGRDFTRDFQLRVLDITDRGVSVLTQDDLVYANVANLPERAVTAVAVPYMGLQFNVPGAATYPGSAAYPITFYADGEHIIRSVFERWSQLVFDDATSTGDYRLFDTSRITLVQLNQQMNVTREYVLHGVFPVSVGALQYDMKGNGQVVSFTATLAYQFWRRRLLQR